VGLDNVGFIEARYEVPGNGTEDASVPAGTIETLGARFHIRFRERELVIDRPLRDAPVFRKRDPALRIGLISNVPPGPLSPITLVAASPRRPGTQSKLRQRYVGQDDFLTKVSKGSKV
jgi:hypothetical protein